MTWIRRTEPRAEHRCKTPRTGGYIGYADGAIGDLWRCDECGTVWEIRDVNREHRGNRYAVGSFCKQWRQAGFWKQAWHGDGWWP